MKPTETEIQKALTWADRVNAIGSGNEAVGYHDFITILSQAYRAEKRARNTLQEKLFSVRDDLITKISECDAALARIKILENARGRRKES